MTTPPPRDRFFHNLVGMKAPLLVAVSQCKSTLVTSDLLELAFSFLTFVNHQELIDTFIDRTHQHWELIATTQDVSVILDAALGGFQELGKDRIAEIQRIVKDKEVDSAIQVKLLNIGRSLVKIAIRELQAVGSAKINVPKMAKLYELT